MNFRIASLLETSGSTNSWIWLFFTPCLWENTTGEWSDPGKSSNHVWFAHSTFPHSCAQAGNWTEENESTVERRDGLSGWKRSLEHSIYLLVAGSQADQRGGVSTYRLQGVASHNHWFVIKSSSCLKISLSSFILRYILVFNVTFQR